ncbi:MAG TPA: SprT family zinc-dependent metalloprotease [Xanthomonadaceae bacterium]|nr:SprT family zinc-dependent metalloprotease [Xanthomonadaceae bacterium]
MPRLRTRKIRRETIPLRLSDGRPYSIDRVRDPRARRLRLIVSEGRVRLTVPPWASAREAARFLVTSREWIEQQVVRQLAEHAARRPLRFGDAGPVAVRGQPHALCWHEGVFGRADLDPSADLIHLTAPRGRPQSAGAALGALFEAEARRELGRLLPRYLPTLPRPPLSFRMRPLASLWGSMSIRDGLSLDLSLILGPPAAFEYVLVHELCHLLVDDHSRRFWREVEARFPDWRAQRDYLRTDGLALKAELKRLTCA